MKTASELRQGAKENRFPPSKWYRVRPALGWGLALGLSALLALCIHPATRDIFAQQLPGLARWIEDHSAALLSRGPLALNALAFAAVTAVAVAGLRTSRRVRRLRRKMARTFRFTQRLLPGSRAARA